MINKIILASKSGVRKKILDENDINCEVVPSHVDEDQIKEALLKEKASPSIISKNLAELKANKVSRKTPDILVLGADSVIDLNGELISKPKNREEALHILQKLNGQKHKLISSVCISKNGSMIWNFTDSSTLTMKKLNIDKIKSYLEKIRDKELYSYGVYQIEAGGRSLFSNIEGDEDTIMGLPVKHIKKYLKNYK
jgi:septum formation protein